MISSFFSPLHITIITLAVASVFFMQGKVRADLVSVCALLTLMVTNVLTPYEALSGFSNPVVIMMIGLFIVGAGIFRTGLAKMISSRILQLAGSSETKLFLLIMLVTAFIGSFVSNTGTVAVMIPIVVSMAAGAGISARKYLMPLAFASSMGGMFTLIGTPPNMVIQEALQNGGYEPLSFFSFTPVGVVCLLTGIIVLALFSRWFLTEGVKESSGKKRRGKTLNELIDEYKLNTIFHIRVPDGARLLNRSVSELRIRSVYNISILRIDRPVVSSLRFRRHAGIEPVMPDTVIEKGDILFCHGNIEHISRFVSDNRLELLDEYQDRGSSFSDFHKTGIAEVIILPDSQLVNRTIKETCFREEFNVTILGLQRQNQYQMYDIKDQKLRSGDALLIQGTWDNIANLANRQDDLVLLGQPLEEASKVTLTRKAPVAAAIMVLMVLAMALNAMPAVTAVLVAAVLMIMTGCLRNMEEAYKNINWESVILIGAMMPMSLAFEKTGAAALISGLLVDKFGAFGPHALLAGIYFGTSLLTLFISNTATAVLFCPIALQAAVTTGVSPYPFLFAVTVAASMCFASPFSTPPNALVMPAGRYTFMDYIKVGLPLQIIMGIVMIGVLPLLYSFD